MVQTAYDRNSVQRIQWSEKTRRNLAKATADTLVQQGLDKPFNLKYMMVAFRLSMNSVLRPHEYRYIGGPSQALWLEGYVKEALRKMGEPKTTSTEIIPFVSPVQEVEIVVESGNDTNELLVDVVASLETRVNKSEERILSALADQNDIIIAQTIVIESLLAHVNQLGGDVETLGEIITRQKERVALKQIERQAKQQAKAAALPPPPVIEQPHIHILIMGGLRGQQARYVNEAASLYPHIKLTILDTQNNYDDLPIHDHAIVMEWGVRNSAAYYNRMLPKGYEVATGVTNAAKIIDTLAQK